MNVLLGVCGGIAAYKMLDVASALKKRGIEVDVILTQSACEFVTRLSFETVIGGEVFVDGFECGRGEVLHIELAKRADLVLIAPATGNIIGKLASGIADDLLLSTLLAVQCPVVIAPAMNSRMYDNVIVQQNIQRLKSLGFGFVEPKVGLLACGDVGVGRLAPVDELVRYVCNLLGGVELQVDTPNDIAVMSELDAQMSECVGNNMGYQKDMLWDDNKVALDGSDAKLITDISAGNALGSVSRSVP